MLHEKIDVATVERWKAEGKVIRLHPRGRAYHISVSHDPKTGRRIERIVNSTSLSTFEIYADGETDSDTCESHVTSDFTPEALAVVQALVQQQK